SRGAGGGACGSPMTDASRSLTAPARGAWRNTATSGVMCSRSHPERSEGRWAEPPLRSFVAARPIVLRFAQDDSDGMTPCEGLSAPDERLEAGPEVAGDRPLFARADEPAVHLPDRDPLCG